MEDGPFIRGLDETLQSLNIHREAYYGGTFTGNHAHKCLTVRLELKCFIYTYIPDFHARLPILTPYAALSPTLLDRGALRWRKRLR